MCVTPSDVWKCESLPLEFTETSYIDYDYPINSSHLNENVNLDGEQQAAAAVSLNETQEVASNVVSFTHNLSNNDTSQSSNKIQVELENEINQLIKKILVSQNVKSQVDISVDKLTSLNRENITLINYLILSNIFNVYTREETSASNDEFDPVDFNLDNSENAEQVPCQNNTRFPSKNDCTRYYTCDSTLNSIREFSCPLKTAFDESTGNCTENRYKECVTNNSTEIYNILSSDDEQVIKDDDFLTSGCQAFGKHSDPSSTRHYYLCYYSTDVRDYGKLKPLKLECPNALLFCGRRKVCTTRELCKT